MLTAGQEIELLVEKPAAGGRMIARHGGQVVFVAGAIPGERVRRRSSRRGSLAGDLVLGACFALKLRRRQRASTMVADCDDG